MEQTETNRVEAFSDGVFAIAITLLILEIRVPEAGEIDPQLLLCSYGWNSESMAVLKSQK